MVGKTVGPRTSRRRGDLFTTTHWSVVLAAGDSRNSQAEGALEHLCASYWYPVYAFVRRRGFDSETAKDLTQSFFTRMLEKKDLRKVDRERGRFRCFILTAVKNFLANEWDRQQAQKRGGGATLLSIDLEPGERRYCREPAEMTTPESFFEKRWALTVLERVLGQLKTESAKKGYQRRFERLKSLLIGGVDAGGSYRQIADELQMTEAAVKMCVYRMRRRFGSLLRQEIAQTVTDENEVHDEIRYLMATVST